MFMKKIIAITGTRADYGIYRPVLRKIEESQVLTISLIVVGMHLSEEFGYTIKEIKKDGFKIERKIAVLSCEDTRTAMAKSFGKYVIEIANTFEKTKPDILLLLGDRCEMLAGAVAATYMGIPIAHIHGGEISGNVDEPIRHAISKLAHIHFTATKESAKRLIRMGEEPWRIYVVGAPSLDTILNEKLISPVYLAKKYNLDLSQPIIMLIQHPVVNEADDAANQIRETLEAITELKYQTIVIYPNSDAGGRRMIEVIKNYEKYPFIKSFKSLSHKEYLSFMRMATVMVGNSSSGIIEAPSFGLPVVNIGTRQEGRQRAENIIDVNYCKEEIKNAIQKAVYDKEFREKVSKIKNFYGDGKAGIRIANILSRLKITKELLNKRMTY